MRRLLFYVCLVTLATSCATIFGGSKKKVTVDNTRPITSPVTIQVDKTTYSNVNLPFKVRVKRGFKKSYISGSAEGYTSDTTIVRKQFNGTTLWNLVLGGIPGFAIDAATGAMTKPDANRYILNMQPKNYVEQDANKTPEQPQILIIQDAPQPQSTQKESQPSKNLSSTVIRWYFESQPQGARIFWRVVSSIPNEVKNTNELWLGNTPFEETRAFNIQGLTYENSANVQIEIKVRRNGYIDQTKRFNVRQAIDQQEISSFFDMIKVE